MNRPANPYKRHRFPPAIIQHAVWLYHRFDLSHRDIEDPVAERGMRRFSSPEQAQRFLSAHAVVYSLFNLQRHLASACFYRLRRARAFEHWNQAVAA
jgi:transposase-like protein